MTDDPQGLADFARRETAVLIGYVLKFGVGYQDAEDIAAETMRRMFQQWSAIDSPRAWAHTTASRLAIDAMRRRRIERGSPPSGTTAQLLEPAVDELFMLKEEQRRVIGLIRELPGRQRSVLALHLDGYSNTEIAGILGANPRTVASHLRHARQRLRQALEAEGHYGPVPAREGVRGE